MRFAAEWWEVRCPGGLLSVPAMVPHFFVGTVRGWGRVLDALRSRVPNLDLRGDVHKGKRNLKASRKVLDIIKSDVFLKMHSRLRVCRSGRLLVDFLSLSLHIYKFPKRDTLCPLKLDLRSN